MNKIKTAGIITYWKTDDNYGTILQNYALQKVLIKYNISPVTICHEICTSFSFLERVKKVIKQDGVIVLMFKILKRFLYFGSACLVFVINKRNSVRQFDRFQKNNLNMTKVYTKYEELELEQGNYDLYIAGADQIWNFTDFQSSPDSVEIKTRFLQFSKTSSLKASCAASFGVSCFSDIASKYLKKYLPGFDFISIREQSGVRFCSSLGIENVVCQPDPSFLLSVDEYRNLYQKDKSFLPKKKFILLYLLNNDSDFSIRNLKKWARENNLDVVYISGNEIFFKVSFYKKFYATIPQFLELYDKAEYVITNSFHGTCFSILYNKNFISIRQTGKYLEQTMRIDSVLQIFNLQNRFFSTSFNLLFNSIDYTTINKCLDDIRNKSPFVMWIKNNIKN